MSDEAVEETGGTEAEDGKVGGKKRLIIMIVGILLAIGLAVGLYFSGMFGGKGEEAPEAASEESHESGESEGGHGDGKAVAGVPVFYELPEVLVNLNTSGKQVSFLKMKVAIELERQEDVAKVEGYMPRVSDGINTYVRELRSSDLTGSAGMARLKEELLLRINKSLEGVAKVRNIYIKEMLVQ